MLLLARLELTQLTESAGHAIFHAQHAWDLQGFAHHVPRGPSYQTVLATTTARNTTPRATVWLLALLDFTSPQTQPAAHADRIAKNAAAQQLAPNARQTCTLTWAIVWSLVPPILSCRQATLAWLAIFLAELAKTYRLNVSLAPRVTITMPELKDV